MSNRRKLRPHELAKRDQCLADAVARLNRGQGVIWTDLAEPGTQCSYCDCPIGPGSPHAVPGYVCDDPCTAEAVYVVIVLSHPDLRPVLLCERHHDNWCGDFVKLAGRRRVDVIGPWLDD